MQVPETTPQLQWHYELVPLLPLNQAWHWALVVAAGIVLAGAAIVFCRRDSEKMTRPAFLTFLVLSVLPVLGLLVFFLGVQRQGETRIVQPSELLVLVDTSLSMGLNDEPTEPSRRRIDPVIELFQGQELLVELNRHHRIRVFRFDDSQRVEEVASFARTSSPNDSVNESSASEAILNRETQRLIPFWLDGGLLIAGVSLLLVIGIGAAFGANQIVVDWGVAFGVSALLVGLSFAAVAEVTRFDTTSNFAALREIPGDKAALTKQITLDQVNWSTELAPQGTGTRLGDALLDLVSSYRSRATAGLLLVTDGRSNQGSPVTQAIVAVADANLPIYVVGTGSDKAIQNARLSDIQVPQKVFPGDRFEVRAVIQSTGLLDQSARVQLLTGDESASVDALTVVDEIPWQLGDNDQPQTIEFPITSQLEGTQNYAVRILPVAGELDATDNIRRASVQIETRKTRVLLVAGGPTRDYQFLRNQLFRDDDVTLDVWLQLTQPGADQESDQMLFAFPETAGKLFEYDCLVAFDPDWRKLSTEQARWLERWISQKAGGMIVIAGPVNTPEWTRQPRGDEAMDLIRRLYPVSFYSQGSAALKLGRFGGVRSFPLEFSREGLTADYLQLVDTLADNVLAWKSFDGVFGYYAVNETRRGADVLARFSDPETSIDGEQPVWLASQLYGSGRVVFQGSGEIWRLRDGNVDYFQRYYLNLMRWVSQGRLLRESQQAILLVDRNRCWVGDQVVVRTIVNDPAGNPILADNVQATVNRPDGTALTITLNNDRDATNHGSFSGQFLAGNEGVFQIRFPLTGDSAGKELRAEVEASIPDLEKVNPQRNDALLQVIADGTGGRYFSELKTDGTAIAHLPDSKTDPRSGSGDRIPLTGATGLVAMIRAVDQELWLPGTSDQGFSRRLAAWLTGWLVLVLCLRWSLRRFYKLA